MSRGENLEDAVPVPWLGPGHPSQRLRASHTVTPGAQLNVVLRVEGDATYSSHFLLSSLGQPIYTKYMLFNQKPRVPMNQNGDTPEVGREGSKTLVEPVLLAAWRGTWLLVPRTILEGHLRAPKDGQCGDCPQLGKVCGQRHLLKVTLSLASSSWGSCPLTPTDISFLTAAVFFKSELLPS